MKNVRSKFMLVIMMVSLLLVVVSQAFAVDTLLRVDNSAKQEISDVAKSVLKGIGERLKAQGIDPDVVKVVVDEEFKELPGFRFITLDIRGQEISIVTNGKYALPNVVDMEHSADIVEKYKLKFAKPVEIEVSKEDFYFGNPEGKVKIVVFSDFECPFCKRASIFMKPLLEKNKDKVAIYYKHFPLSFHKHAKMLARAYEAAKELGYHLDLYNLNLQGKTEDQILDEIAGMLKDSDRAKFKELAKSSKYDEKINKDYQYGTKLGVKGTPYIVIDGKVINGFNPALIETTIKEAIKKYYK